MASGGTYYYSNEPGGAAVHMGTEPSHAASDNVHRTEEEYRAWLDRRFKPMFDPYESKGGIPNEEMLRFFQYDSHGVPRHKLNGFLDKMDKNKDGRVSYKEFYSSMIRKRKQDLSRGKRLMLGAILAASPSIKGQQRKKDRDKDEIDSSTDQVDGEIPDSYLEAYNCRPPPLFIPICCIAQLICFIVYAVEINGKKDQEWNRVSWTSGVPYWSPLLYDPKKRQEAWRFISYMFLHVGYHHIIFNMIMQILLGIPLEVVHKAWRVGPVFLAGVLAGSLASSVGDPSKNLAGASGGCYALIGAHYALVIMNWEELQHEWLNCRDNPLRFLFSGVMRLILLSCVLIVDFGLALYKRYGLSAVEQTSFAAHIGGLLAGLVVGIPVLKNIEKKPWEVYVFWLSIVIFALLTIFGILWNILYTGFPKADSGA